MKEYKVKCDWCKQPIENERYEEITINHKNYQLHKKCEQEIQTQLEKGQSKTQEKKKQPFFDIDFSNDEEEENEED